MFPQIRLDAEVVGTLLDIEHEVRNDGDFGPLIDKLAVLFVEGLRWKRAA